MNRDWIDDLERSRLERQYIFHVDDSVKRIYAFGNLVFSTDMLGSDFEIRDPMSSRLYRLRKWTLLY